MKFIALISKIDLLGNPIQFRIKGSEKFRSIFGGILSFIIVTLVSLLGLTLSLELFYRTNPSVSISATYRPNLSISLKDKFPLILYFASNNGSSFYQQERLFDIVGFSMLFNIPSDNNTQSSIVFENLNISVCTKEFIQENYGEFSDLFLNAIPSLALNSKVLLCLKPPNSSNYSLLNNFGSNPSQSVQFFLTQCNNKTKNYTCRSKEEINTILTNAVFYIYTPDIFFDHKNYDNPGVSYINTQIFVITSTLYKRFFIYLKLIDYMSDNGIVLSDFKNYTYFQLDKLNQEVFLAGVSTLVPNSIANFCFSIQANTYNTYSRKYTNIPQILANLGGAFNSMMIISLIINYFLERNLKNVEIFNICCNETLIKKNLKAVDNQQKNQNNVQKDSKTNNFIKENPNKSSDKTKEIFQTQDLLTRKQENMNNFEFSRKSIILDHPEIENLIDINFNFFQIIFPFLRNQHQKRKIFLSKKFSDQILEIDFILGNLLENQFYNLLKSHK